MYPYLETSTTGNPINEGGRIQAVDTQNPSDCAMKINEIKQSDSGNWQCNVTCTKCDNGKYDVGVNVTSVIIVSEVTLYNKIVKLTKQLSHFEDRIGDVSTSMQDGFVNLTTIVSPSHLIYFFVFCTRFIML